MTLLPWRQGLFILGCIVSYVVIARLGLSLATLHGNVSPVWPATGFAIGLLVRRGLALWPVIFVGAYITNALTDIPLAAAIGIACGNTLEALIGASIIRSRTVTWQLTPELHRPAKILLASIFASLVSAAIGTISLTLLADAPHERAFEIAVTWFLGDCLGALVFVPLLAAYEGRDECLHRYSGRTFDAICTALLIGMGIALFGTSWGPKFPFLVLPLLLVCAALARRWLLDIAPALITLMALTATTIGHGSFVAQSTNDGLIYLQTFMAAVAINALFLSAFRNLRTLWLAGAVLVIGWFCTTAVYLYFSEQARFADRQRFQQLIEQAEKKIDLRMRVYEDALHSAVSLFASSESVEGSEWRQFVQSLDLGRRYPGIHGMGVVWPVLKHNVAGYEARIRSELGPLFGVTAQYDSEVVHKPDRFIITYIEPMEQNRAAWGFDVGSEARRRVAAERARETGLPTMTRRISLVQDTLKQPGFLLFVPMYRKGAGTATKQDRIENFEAWVYAPFITKSFFSSIEDSMYSKISLEVLENDGEGRMERIYGSLPESDGSPELVTSLELAGNSLSLLWSRREEFGAVGQFQAVVVSFFSAILTLILATLVGVLALNEQRASALVQRRTAELEASKQFAEQAAERERQASAAKGAFIANMSHEFRTPLNGIFGMTNLLLESKIDSEQRELLTAVKSSSESLRVMIDDILDVSKIEAGKLSIHPYPVEIREFVRRLVLGMSGKIKEKNLVVTYEIDPAIENTIWVDETRLGQILINLLGNAIKFTPSGGFVSISLKSKVKSPKERIIEFAVRDSGIGIAADKLQQIFEAFSQADSSTTRRFGGTGLGLTISRELVGLMGGEIAVESELGKGSCFSFAIPVEVGIESGERESEAVALNSRPLRILLAEDNPVNQLLVIKMLEKCGHEVILAKDGHEALEKFLKSDHFDLVLMDCQMPVVSGFEATHRIREYERTSGGHIPIIAMTANAMEGDRKACIEAGMDDYIAKPFEKNTLLRLLQRWSNGTFEGGLNASPLHKA